MGGWRSAVLFLLLSHRAGLVLMLSGLWPAQMLVTQSRYDRPQEDHKTLSCWLQADCSAPLLRSRLVFPTTTTIFMAYLVYPCRLPSCPPTSGHVVIVPGSSDFPGPSSDGTFLLEEAGADTSCPLFGARRTRRRGLTRRSRAETTTRSSPRPSPARNWAGRPEPRLMRWGRMWSQGQRGGVSACVTGIGVENLAPGCWRGAAKSLPGGGGRRRREEIGKKKRREGEAWRREEGGGKGLPRGPQGAGRREHRRAERRSASNGRQASDPTAAPTSLLPVPAPAPGIRGGPARER